MQTKDLTFLKELPFFHAGIYDNNIAFEHTVKAIDNAIKSNVGIQVDIKKTSDNEMICFADDDLNRLIHVEDKTKTIDFENLDYMAKFPILKLSELLPLVNDQVPLLIKLSKNDLNYKLKVMDYLIQYKGRYAIVSDDIDTLKWLKKNYPKIIIGYKIDKNNMHRFHIFNKYDFMVVDVNLYDDKHIRKQREEKFIIGSNIKDDDMYESKKDVYDNLICESQLDNR